MSYTKIMSKKKSMIIYLIIGIIVGFVFGKTVSTNPLSRLLNKTQSFEEITKDWKTVVSQANWASQEMEKQGKESIVYFSYRYPPRLEVQRFPGRWNYGTCRGIQGCSHFLGRDEEAKPGEMYVYTGLYWLKGGFPKDTVASSSAILGGKSAFRLTFHGYPYEPLVSGVDYRIENLNIKSVDDEHGFMFTCYYIPSPTENIEELCDQISKTFIFEARVYDKSIY